MQNGEVKSCLTRATLQNRYRVVMVKWSACLPLTPLIRVWNLQFWFCKIVWTVVVAQLVERSLPTPEIRSSNPVRDQIYMHYQLYWKDENKQKWGREWPILNKTPALLQERFDRSYQSRGFVKWSPTMAIASENTISRWRELFYDWHKKNFKKYFLLKTRSQNIWQLVLLVLTFHYLSR